MRFGKAHDNDECNSGDDCDDDIVDNDDEGNSECAHRLVMVDNGVDS